MSSHPLPPAITDKIPFSVTAVALGTFNLEFVLRFERAELKPDKDSPRQI